MESAPFNGDFARLIPRNRVAQLLFSKTYVYVEKNDTFHLQFMDCSDDNAKLLSFDEPVESSTDYDSHAETDTEGSDLRNIHHLGHFILSFNKEREPELPHVGWRVGRGTSKYPSTRGVDLLLAKPGDIRSKSLANIHMLFRFNQKSGFLMLRAESPKMPVEYNRSGIWETLEYENEQIMYQSSTMVRAGTCEYELKYTVEEKHREAYFDERTAFFELLKKNDSEVPIFRILPGDNCVSRGRYLEFQTKGSGAFGWITQAVDIKTGDPIAIKEVRIQSRTDGLDVMDEVRMGKRFLDQRGLLPILEAFCEHGKHEFCCNLEKYYISMPHAQSDLSIDFWNDSKISRNTKLQWLREPLEGIRTMHAMGVMHRDIRLQNMLIMADKPPRASLCDYGKAIESQTSTVTTIGPIPTLAPEVWTVSTSGPYGLQIDMWAYGFAIAQILIFARQRSYGAAYFTENVPITPERYSAILGMLVEHCSLMNEDSFLVVLVLKLLVWDPKERWSAEQALQHECWNSIMEQEGKKRNILEEEPSEAKRAHT